MGLPVSSTHIAIGALFGVGFLREYLANKENGAAKAVAENTTVPRVAKDPRIKAEKMRRRYLVRRSHMITIVAAWVITVPVTGIIAALLAWLIWQETLSLRAMLGAALVIGLCVGLSVSAGRRRRLSVPP